MKYKHKIQLALCTLLWIWMAITAFDDPSPNALVHGWAYTGVYAVCMGVVTFALVVMWVEYVQEYKEHRDRKKS